MTESGCADIGWSAGRSRYLRTGSPDCARHSCISRSPPTRTPLCEQSSSDQIQVGQRRRQLKAMQVLCQAPIPDLADAEDVLDDPEHVFDLGADPRLVAVLRFLDLVDPAVEAIATIREVLGLRRYFADDCGLPLINPGRLTLVSPGRAAGGAMRRGRARWRPTP